MSVYEGTHEILGHTHLGVSIASEIGENSPPNKGMEL